MVDEDHLVVAFDALVENALKVTGEGDLITLHCHRRGDVVTLTVGDSGPGIPESNREQVFQRFWRSPVGSSDVGSGIGLACVRSVALAHGGETCVGRSDEGGAVVGLRVPACPRPAHGGGHGNARGGGFLRVRAATLN